MRYIKIISILMVLAVISCQRLQYPEKDSSTDLNSLKCYVYYNSDNLTGEYAELNILEEGTYNASMGAVSYTFPTDQPDKFNEQSLKRCRLEATIPSTATLVETDSQGNEKGSGIGGFRDFSARRTTVYFKVVAADGSQKKYQAQFQYAK